jgi:hypothetical protein
LKPVFHWRRDGNSDIQLTGYIVIYHQIVAWKLSLDHKLDVYWTCFGRYFELAEGKKTIHSLDLRLAPNKGLNYSQKNPLQDTIQLKFHGQLQGLFGPQKAEEFKPL